MEKKLAFERYEELIEAGKLKELKDELVELNIVDIAEFISEIEDRHVLLVFRILPKDIAAEVFAYLDTESQTQIVQAISESELHYLVEEMYTDDAVDFLEEVPANIVRRVLSVASPETRADINRFLEYPENSAGSVMTNEMVELHDTVTAGDAISFIRRNGIDKETIYNCYVIDSQRHLEGVLPLRRLLLAQDSSPVRDLMDDDRQVISVGTLEDQEAVADIARKYDLLAVPVVDRENRLVGIITIDDIVDIIEDENTEDFEKMALLQPAEDTYLKTGVFTLARNRIVWLMILMISATFTGKIITGFENMLAAVAGLTACIPMLMDTGGNAGNQTSTLIIRGLALGEIRVRDYFRVLFKELRVALLCGTLLAAVNFLRMMLVSEGGYETFLIVSISMLCAVIFAKAIGCTLPIFARVVHLDPALMAGPMITTIVDGVTLLIYFSLARAFLM